MPDPLSSSPGNSFTVSYDRTTKIVTAIACAFLIGVPLVAHTAVGGAICALVIGVSYAISPRGYMDRGTPVLLEVKQPEAFIQQLRHAWQ